MQFIRGVWVCCVAALLLPLMLLFAMQLSTFKTEISELKQVEVEVVNASEP